jgi:DNA-binding beta-propeller fold protein YncE
MHGIAYNEEADEIIVPNPLAAAILVFRGGAAGAEPPVRIIQGSQTQMAYPHSVNIDPVNKEILVGDPGGRKVLAFPLYAQGDVKPLRVLGGPKTKLGYIVGMSVDPARNLLVVSSSSIRGSFEAAGGHRGLLIFNRTDNGDVAPRAAIGGPKTGIISGAWQVHVDSQQGKIFIAVGNSNNYRPRYAGEKLRDSARDSVIRSPWRSEHLGFVAVWNIDDNGDIPPRALIKGHVSGLVHPVGLALNPRHGEVIVTDSVRNSTFVFSVPEFFSAPRNGRPAR